MSRIVRLVAGALVGVGVAAGCSMQGASPSETALAVEGGHSLDAVPWSARLRLQQGADWLPTELWLVRGEVSSSSSSRLRRQEIPNVVAEARLPLATWRNGDDLVLQPLEILEPATVYSVAAPLVGAIASFSTAPKLDDQHMLFRWGEGPWLPGGWVLYCPVEPPRYDLDAASAPPLREASAGSSTWGLSGDPVHWVWEHGGEPGLGSQSKDAAELPNACLQLRIPDGAEDHVLPPAQVGSTLLEPGLLSIAPSEPQQPACANEQQPPLCASVSGAFLQLEAPQGVLRVQISAREQNRWDVLRHFPSSETWTIGPVQGDTTLTLWWTWLSPEGAVTTGSWPLPAFRPEARLVLSEVLADARGAEPESEWVEIVNAGNASANLEGLKLQDSSQTVRLPGVELSPGEYGVVVSADYRPNPALEPIPDASAKPIIVEALPGFRNDGETVSLLSGEDRILSRIPAVAGKEGVSVARREILAPDNPSSFQLHGSPGASPGAPNAFD